MGGRRSVPGRFFGLLWGIGILLNVLSWICPALADFYAARLFSRVTLPLARLTSLVPFSVGEAMILFGLLWLALLALHLLRAVPALVRRRPLPKGFRPFLRRTGRLLSVILLVMTLNCFLLYHCSPLEDTLPGAGRQFDAAELTALRDAIVTRCNDYAARLPRDEAGDIRMDFDAAEEARRAVASLGWFSPRLAGFQPMPKPLFFSDFISQQHMMGYYFPFSMEANYNAVMERLNRPYTMCHELAHTHGYILEDDANFIGYLACIGSDNPVVAYSGCLGVLNYVNNDFYRTVGKSAYYAHEPAVSDLVWHDQTFLSDSAWEGVERRSPLDTETVHRAADAYVDTTLKANGVRAGKASYSHVVALLLSYYSGREP